MIDFEDASERTKFVNEIHGLCAACKGHGFYMDGLGNEHPCPFAQLHSDIDQSVTFGLESAGEYKRLQDTNVELLESNGVLADGITNLTGHIMKIREVAQSAGSALDGFTELVYSEPQSSTVNEIRSAVLHEMVDELHYPMDGLPDTCICGENWGGEDRCAEARRILIFADDMIESDNEEEGGTFA